MGGRVETPQEPQSAPSVTPSPEEARDETGEDKTRAALVEVREQLREMLTLLNRDGKKGR
jgi:hypothetical protein